MYFCPSGAASSAITATIDNTCQIKDCAAENNGGGIYAISTAATAIHTLDVRCSITGCTAGFYGQKIFKDKNDLSMRLTVKYNGVPNEENKKAWD